MRCSVLALKLKNIKCTIYLIQKIIKQLYFCTGMSISNYKKYYFMKRKGTSLFTELLSKENKINYIVFAEEENCNNFFVA